MKSDKWDSLSEISKAMHINMQEYQRTGTKPWTASTGLVDLAYQAGHLLKLKMQLENERHLEGKTRREILDSIQTELAEVIAITTFIASDLKLDLSKGFQSMLEGDAKKIVKRSKKN